MVAWSRALLQKFMCMDTRVCFHRSTQSELINEIKVDRKMLNKRSSRSPFFELRGLESGQGYDIMVMAVNKKGKSRPAMLHGYTLKTPERQTGKRKFYLRHQFVNFPSPFSCFSILRDSHFTSAGSNVSAN